MLLPERGRPVRIGRKAEKVFVLEIRKRSEVCYDKRDRALKATASGLFGATRRLSEAVPAEH